MMKRIGLRHARDAQSVAYLVAVPMLALWQWQHGFDAALYAAMIVLWIGIGVIHHHHAHRPMWHARRANHATDLLLALLQGHPTYGFAATHNRNHHRHRHGPGDWARTYRFAGGDSNHALGYLLHPLQAACALYPHFLAHLGRMRRYRPGVWRWALLQYALVSAAWIALLVIDAPKALLYMLLPQLVALHTLLGANYFQHAHADGRSRWHCARNFTGAINWLYFNIGFHSAHHEHPREHWSCMPALHQTLRANLHPALQERSFFVYLLRVMALGALLPRFRSRSLMASTT
jgi:hypothetical protein